MSKVKVVLNRAGIRALMQSKEMQLILYEIAENATDFCGDGYDFNTDVGKNRANAMVYAETYQAKADNLRNNTILKSIKAVR